MRSVLYKLSLLALCLPFFAGCAQKQETVEEPQKVIHLSDGAVVLEDKEFGIYYGDKYGNELSVFYVVLSDARCYINGLSSPYMDSDGDMLVLELCAPAGSETLPDGVYECSKVSEAMTFTSGFSYVIRFDGYVQSKWEIVEGSISFSRGADGVYDIYTEGFVIEKSSVRLEVEYVANTALLFRDYMLLAPGLFGPDDDIIDLPFYEVSASYYGNLYESGSGNYTLQFATKGIMEDETGHLPGVFLEVNCFSTLYSAKVNPVLTAGEYEVSMTSESLFQFGTMLPGMDYNGTGTPFGSYMYQQTEDSDLVLNYISTGTLNVSYDENDICTLEVNLSTSSSRKITGKWTGKLDISNYATSNGAVVLSTLTEDVDCNLEKVSDDARIRCIETLHRNNITPEKDYDIATVWQLFLEPRGWTDEEKKLDYAERIKKWAADGDVMILEFILPLKSNGDIAPEPGKEYVYTIQPYMDVEDPNYTMCVSKEGRPYDELFDYQCGIDYNYANFMTYGDYIHARRGFTWAGSYRGNWYMHYKTGSYMVMDEMAPMIHGTVKVVREADYKYTLKWELEDDTPEVPNKVTGEWFGSISR